MKGISRKKGVVTWGLPINHRCLSVSCSGDKRVVRGSHTHTRSLKNAIDFCLKTGSEVLASNDGVVVATASHFSVGGMNQRLRPRANYIVIIHPSIRLYSRYYHLKKDGVLVNVGDKVYKGQVIGLSGNTGYSSGPHLHFDVVQILPEHISCLEYFEKDGTQTIEAGLSGATWIRVPSIPASFSAPIPLKEDQLILKLMDAADSRVAGLRPSSVAVLIDRSVSDMPFQDVCETAAQEASGSAGAIIVANMNPGPELFQMVSTSKDFSMDLACLLISHESGLHLWSSMTMKEVWISISLEPTSTVRSSTDPDVWKPLRPQTQSIIFDNKPPEYCCHCPLL